MSGLKNWTIKKIGEIGDIVSGSTPSTRNPAFWDGEIVWVTPSDLSKLNTPYLNTSNKKITKKGLKSCSAILLPAGSIVISSRAPIGYVAIPTLEFCTNQGCKSIRLYNQYDSEFIYYNIKYNIEKIKNFGEGTTFAEISKAALSRIEMPFLKSKTEQTLIAEILSTADRAIEQTEALIAKLQRIKTGLMQDLLTRGIDKHGNIRSEETHEFKDSPLGRIPVEWEVEPIDNYLIKGSGIKPGPFGSSLKKEIYTNSGYKVYGQEQVIEGSLAIGNYYIDKKRYHRMRTFSIKEGDVLISLVGTIGHVLIVRKPFEEGIINPRLLRFRPNLYKCYPPFLRYLLLSESTQIQLISLKTGGTMPVLSGTSIKKLIVPKIKKEEQEKIGHTIRFLEEMIEKENRYLGKLKLIKQALMQDLLTGKVRVTELLKKRQAEES